MNKIVVTRCGELVGWFYIEEVLSIVPVREAGKDYSFVFYVCDGSSHKFGSDCTINFE